MRRAVGFLPEPYGRAAYLPRYRYYMDLLQGLASRFVVPLSFLPAPYSRIPTSVGISINLLAVSTRLSCLRYPLYATSPISHLHIALPHPATASEYAPHVPLQFLGIYIEIQARYLLSPLKGNRPEAFQRMGMHTVPCQGHPRAGYTGRIQPTGCQSTHS